MTHPGSRKAGQTELKQTVQIYEVAPRDGLQNEPEVVFRKPAPAAAPNKPNGATESN